MNEEENQPKEYQLYVDFCFTVRINIMAKDYSEAELIVNEHCAVVGAKFYTVDNQRVVDWELNPIPEKTVIRSDVVE